MSGDHSTEIWKAIPGFAGYEVSDLGQVRSLWERHSGGRAIRYTIGATPRLLKQQKNRDGYLCVDLSSGQGRKARKVRRVHTLVLLAFVGEPPPGLMACHTEQSDRTNNKLSNLRWGTRSDNNGLDVTRHCGKHPCSKLSPADVREVRKLLQKGGMTQREIGKRYGVSRSTITLIAHDKHHRYVE